jgi:hypothetical protein
VRGNAFLIPGTYGTKYAVPRAERVFRRSGDGPRCEAGESGADLRVQIGFGISVGLKAHI